MKTHSIIRGVKLDSTYDVINEDIYKAYEIDKKNNTEKTMKEYRKSINKFCKAIGKPLSEIVEEIKIEQSTTTEEIISQDNNKTIKRTIRFDVNGPNSTVKKYHNKLEQYCLSRGNNNSTTNKEIKRVRTFLKANGIELPKWEFLKEDPPKWELLEKEDIKFVLDECSIIHKSLILFMISAGMRVGDCVELTIGDFMEATKAYHNFVDVEEFIDNAPQDMMGFWSFNPGKTIKYDIACKTFNSPESSNIILQNLRRLKNEYLPRKNIRLKKEGKEELKISKNDALFGSRNSNYKGKMKVDSISTLFPTKNKKLHEWRVNKIQKAIEEGKISKEDFEKEVDKIPKFHAHACRKYFETMISRNCGDIRICTLMEGHASPVKTDPHYIKKEFDEVQEIYLQAIEDLTIENVDSKLLSNKKISELESTIENLKEDQAKKDEIIQLQAEKNKQQAEEIENLKENQSNLDTTVEDLSERLKEMGKQLKHLDNENPLDVEIKQSLENHINYLVNENKFLFLNDDEIKELERDNSTNHLEKQLQKLNEAEILTVKELSYEIATQEGYDGTFTNTNNIIKKALFKLKRNPDLIIKVENYYDELGNKIEKHTEIYEILMEKIEEQGLWNEDEAHELQEKIMSHVMSNKKYVQVDITEDLVMDLIEEFM